MHREPIGTSCSGSAPGSTKIIPRRWNAGPLKFRRRFDLQQVAIDQARQRFGRASVSGLGIGWRRHSIAKSAQLGTEVLDTARAEWLRVVPLPPVTPQSSSTAATGEGEPPTPSPCQFYDWWRGLTRVRFAA